MSMSPSAGRNASTRANSPPIHPCGVTVEIVGTGRSDRGRSCEEHDVCGTVLEEDSVVRIRRMQIIGDTGKEESALAVYWISDGIDRCRVGFLPRHLMKQWQLYDGRIAQVVDVYEGSESPTKQSKNVRNCGCCEAVLIDSRDEEGATGSSDNRKRTSSEKNDSSAANKQQKQQE
ncbi:hypothetical protein MHU86_24620 [Fragilaria crotonensis]|nr:hypothetical protein MHU86_24620 [Fragilaria crotonensis]